MTTPPQAAAFPPPNGGIALHEGPTRRRRAAGELHVVQNPHCHPDRQLCVTNVVKPARLQSPCEDSCYKHRQSEPKNQHFQRKSRWIDDVCNNAQLSVPSTLQTTVSTPGPTCVEGTGGTGGPGQATHIHPDRLEAAARPAGPGRASRRRAEPHASPPGPTGVEGAGGTGGHGRASRRGAERSEAA